MRISDAAFKQILREYDEKQLRSSRDLRSRIQKIEAEVPQLRQIDSRIAQLSVNMAVMRVKGRKPSSKDEQAYQEEKNRLIQRRRELLEQAGYTLEDLQPRFECNLCQDTGFIDGEKCSCLKARMIDILYDQSNIKDILQKENFSTYSFRYYSPEPLPGGSGESPLSLAKNAWKRAWDFVHHFSETSDNLFITGGTGTGKSFLCNCIAREILDAGYSVIYLSAFKLFGILTDFAFGDRRDRDSGMEDLNSCDLLIIDDLGTEYTNALIQTVFFDCINERLLRNRHTIISTNLSLGQISINYSERVFSRITEKYIYIELLGQDIRISKKMEV